MFGGGASEVEAADAIEISTPEELQKIGKDAAYPLSGDYVLKNDLDMAGSVFTPIGGIEGEKGTVSGDNVFSGTFDGPGAFDFQSYDGSERGFYRQNQLCADRVI